MHPLSANKKEEWLDCLWELEHDLGKYINLPLTWLPADADERQLEEAVRKALFETRRSPRGVRSANEIWSEFAKECEELLASFENSKELVQSVDEALAWERRLSDEAVLDRAAVTADFKRIIDAIRALIEEVRGA